MKRTVGLLGLIFLLVFCAFAEKMAAGGSYNLVNSTNAEMGGAVIGFYEYDFMPWLGARGDLGYLSGGSYDETQNGASTTISEVNTTGFPFFRIHLLGLMPVGEGGLIYFGPGFSYSSNSGEIKSTDSQGGSSVTVSQDFTGSNLGLSMLAGVRTIVSQNLFIYGDASFWNSYQAPYDISDSANSGKQNINIITLGFGVGAGF